MDLIVNPGTGRKALQWALAQLAQMGKEPSEASFEARVLLENASGKNGLEFIFALDSELEESAWEEYRHLIERRSRHEPLQYLLGEQEFMSLPFKVGPAVLIPRGDTQVLVECALQHARSHENPLILDLGTGSGIIAVCLAYYLGDCSIRAVDISPEALALASENAKMMDVQEKIEFLLSDLFSVFTCKEKFHLIVSNPPYISQKEYTGLATDVLKEPRLALLGGEDGLDFYRRIIRQAPDYLYPGGSLLVEIGWKQGEKVKKLFLEHGFSDASVIQDYNGLDRVVSGKKICNKFCNN